MQTSLEGSRAKLRRAKEHLEAVEGKINAFLEPQPYKIILERPAEGLFVIRIANEPPPLPSEEWALVIGDCVHNMRCALDYVAWELAGAIPGDTETLFPIHEHPDGWKRSVWRRKRIPLCALTMMEQAQPYHAKNPILSALNGVRILDDADKHKLLTVTIAVQDTIELTVKKIAPNTGAPAFQFFGDMPLHYGAVLATIAMENAPPEMEVKAHFRPAIAFGHALPMGRLPEVRSSLKNMLKDVTTLVNNFDGKFFAGFGRVYAWAPSREVAAKWNLRNEERVKALQAAPPSPEKR